MKKIILILCLGISLVGCGPSDPEGQYQKALEYFEEASTANQHYKVKEANESAYEWLNKAIQQGYKPAIEKLETIKAEEKARRLAEQKEREEAKRKAEEEAKRKAEEEARKAELIAKAYDFRSSCRQIIPEFIENEYRATQKYTDKKIVITGQVKEINSWGILVIHGFPTNYFPGKPSSYCNIKDIEDTNYLMNLDKGQNVKVVCTGKVKEQSMFEGSAIIDFHNCSEYKFILD